MIKKELILLKNTTKLKKLIILLNILSIHSLFSQQFKTCIINNTKVDSLMVLTQKSYQTSVKKQDSIAIVKNLIKLSYLNRAVQHFDKAFNYAGDALFVAEQLNSPISKALAHEELGVLNYLFKQDFEAGKNFKNAHEIYLRLYKTQKISKQEIYQSYYNLILYYQRIRDIPKLLENINHCSSIQLTPHEDKIHKAYLNEKRATIFTQKQQPKVAITLLKESIATLENLTTSNYSKTQQSFLIILYTSLGNIYRQNSDHTTAKNYYQKALHIEDYLKENTFYLAYVHNCYAETLSKLREYKKAYANALKSSAINTRFLNPRNEKTQGLLKIKNFYSEQLRQKNSLLKNKELELSKQKQRVLTFKIVLYGIISLLIIIGLLAYNRFRQIKTEKQKQLSKKLLNQKNKELTTNTLLLIEREQIINTLKTHLTTHHKTPATKIFLKGLNNQSSNLWESFNAQFTSQNKDFYERLQHKAPTLSASDLKLCALIKLNFTGQEMAYLLGISLGSVHVARHRLRKKIKLDRKTNLTAFIGSI
ncbi:hypothetical protein Q4595_13955 [Wenyingzhuangia sp. 1_MG-2023]|nr:hypothetical protein [Wenyingzhuangia sp. 1_MG-2023]